MIGDDGAQGHLREVDELVGGDGDAALLSQLAGGRARKGGVLVQHAGRQLDKLQRSRGDSRLHRQHRPLLRRLPALMASLVPLPVPLPPPSAAPSPAALLSVLACVLVEDDEDGDGRAAQKDNAGDGLPPGIGHVGDKLDEADAAATKVVDRLHLDPLERVRRLGEGVPGLAVLEGEAAVHGGQPGLERAVGEQSLAGQAVGERYGQRLLPPGEGLRSRAGADRAGHCWAPWWAAEVAGVHCCRRDWAALLRR